MIVDAFKQILDPRRETGGWSGKEVEVFSMINIILNLTQRIYFYLLCSHPISCLIFYLVCCASIGTSIHQIGIVMNNLELTTVRTPRITQKHKYHKGKWKHISAYLPINTRRHLASRTNKGMGISTSLECTFRQWL